MEAWISGGWYEGSWINGAWIGDSNKRSNTMNNFNLSSYAQNLLSGGVSVPRSLASALSGATLTVYSGKQPQNADLALGSDVVALAAFTFPQWVQSVIGDDRIITLENLGNEVCLAAGFPSFARVAGGGYTLFDCSVGVSGTDLIVKHDQVRKGETIRIESGVEEDLSTPAQTKAMVSGA